MSKYKINLLTYLLITHFFPSWRWKRRVLHSFAAQCVTSCCNLYRQSRRPESDLPAKSVFTWQMERQLKTTSPYRHTHTHAHARTTGRLTDMNKILPVAIRLCRKVTTLQLWLQASNPLYRCKQYMYKGVWNGCGSWRITENAYTGCAKSLRPKKTLQIINNN